jgi:hypothetical protein
MFNMKDIALVVLVLFFAVSIGYFAHRIDVIDERLTNVELAR